jgi:hypothetical protein
MNMRKWIIDFETTTVKRKEHDQTAHVWAVGICEVGNRDNIVILKTMKEFIDWCIGLKSNDMLFFHNLKFDGNFIVQWLLKNDYKFISDTREKADKTFMTTISSSNLWYEIQIFFKVRGSKINKVTIRDSYKLIPMSVESIAEEFKLPIKKGHIDYSAHDLLPEGSDITDEEKDYLIKDIWIVEHALRVFQEAGLDKRTIGSCAMADFKSTLRKNFYNTYFPVPFYDFDVRPSYTGAWNYLEPKFRGKKLENILVFDENSMYPSVMAGCNGEIFPCGTPIFFKGEYKYEPGYPLYIQKFECCFKLKKNKLPTVRLKGDYYYGGEYLESSDGDIITLVMTNVDLELFKEQYDITCLQYLDGWMFRAIRGEDVFGEYVRKWTEVKIKAKKEGNWGMYIIAKLMLNSLYGKFGTAPELTNKEPFLGKDGKIHFKKGHTEEKDGVYIAMASFITAYGRARIVREAQRIKDDYKAGKSKIQFVYADTDSLHCISPDFNIDDLNTDLEYSELVKKLQAEKKFPDGLDIHPTRLGAWDHEATSTKGVFIRQKCYMEEHIISEQKYLEAIEKERTIKELYHEKDGKYYFKKITVAGMPSTCHKYVTWENFKVGSTFEGKMEHVTVDGGIVLIDGSFTIQE